MAGNQTRALTTSRSEYTKSFLVYDSAGRLEYVYEAAADAVDGKPCLLTQYGYVTGTTRIEKRRESESTWSSVYDLA